MKLYSQEQVKEMLNKINAVLPERGSLLVYMVENITEYMTPMELPSDEEIVNKWDNEIDEIPYIDGAINGAKWMKEQILNQNK